MKKVFGIVLALSLVLSMSVMAAPVSAAHDITVTLDDPLVGAFPVMYNITFTMQQPLDDTIGEYIDITFPTTTDPSTWTAVQVIGTDSTAPIPVKVTYTAGAGVAVTQLGNTLRLTLDTLGMGLGDLVAGAVSVAIFGVTNPTEQCEHTLWVGTSQETASESPAYEIYAIRIDLVGDGTPAGGWNLISLPVIPDDPDITVVLADLIAGPAVCCTDFEFKVYYYDCTTWYAYNNGSYASLTEMDECRSYWIWVSEDISFYVKGEYYPAPPGPPLKKCYHECWNMVGFTSDVTREPFTNNIGGPPCDQPHDLSPYFGSLAPTGTIIYILRWDTGLDAWGAVIQWDGVAPLAGVPNSNCMVPGEGYWVAFSEDACFAPPPPGV